ncbi:monocarboxylate transporter 12-like [Lytechinus variegatus]|uniref:monocarboxylate transporter 12-like n=1 Tax=Lytechinus variegatus TaxID=7654 RepID=UPI001BB145A1|nr:monocarboxylate transporter 12-like [Lytechinus variegatus]
MEGEHKARRLLVLLCAHMSMVIFGGTYRCLGVFLVEWREYFDTSSTQVSSIVTVLAASGLLSGIPSGIVITRYGCHYGSLYGGVAFIAGTLTSVFAPNPIVLCITMGFLTGLGIGAVRNSAIVAIAHVFKEGFSRANGIALAGGSIGMMLFPPLLQLCIDQFGWRGAMLILSGMQLHIFIAALIFRPPREIRTTENQSKTKPSVSNENKDHELELLKGEDGDHSKRTYPEESNKHLPDENLTHSVDVNHCETKLNCSDQDQIEIHDDSEIRKSCLDDTQEAEGILDDQEVIKEQDVRRVDTKEHQTNASQINEDVQEVLSKSDDVPGDQSGPNESEALVNQSDEVKVNVNDPPITTTVASKRRPSRVQRGLSTSGLSLFCNNVGFCLFNLCQIVLGLCYTGVLTHLVASAVYDGIDQQSASFLMSVFGIANLIARLGSGWIVDLHLLSPEHLYVLCVISFGATMIVSRAWSSYGWYVFIALSFGISAGLFKTLNPVVLKRYVGMKYFARAIGIFYAFTGAGDLIGPVFAGALYDASNSYDLPFYVAGSLLIVSSGLLLLEPPIRRLKERRQARSRMEPNESAV